MATPPASGTETTPVGRITRVVLLLAFGLVFIAGVQLFVLSTRTDDSFAWTIKVPLTAAFLGAGYWGSFPMITWSLRVREWQRVRIVVILALALTTFTLIATLWRLDQFHLGAGSTGGRVAGWAWLVVYVTIPILLVAAFIGQERAGGSREYVVEEPLNPLLRALMFSYGIGMSGLGVGLQFWPSVFHRAWAWPLPPLPAGAVGAWMLALGLGFLWALREGDWRRLQIAYPGLLVYFVLLLIGAARYGSEFGTGRRWPYTAAVAATFALFSLAGWRQLRGQPAETPARAVTSS